ncbi:DUF871 domain-containing protein [Clostridium sp. D2Q-14]|uniref:MupG family TIM beta-alpha barrel fold protein n=1 Tax=Anaeromonas gelatinilytica TaxID=2683194 RepID=UPI00193C3F59|nr:DUF871 domain-containing protein [Anaeromonas gelatinilytica]
MIGISIFSGMDNNIEDNIKYIKEASSLGIKKIFTSIHIPETDKSFEKESFRILKEANKLGMTIMADISKKYFDKINLEEYNIESLRLDFGFNNKEISELTKVNKYNITLNASTLSRKDIEEIIYYGGDLSKINACHNYYPRKDAGISEELFIERNNLFKEYGIEVIAFIPSEYKKRGPIYEGLPTLEKHRGMDPFISSQHLFKLGVDIVFVGDAQASKRELLKLTKINNDYLIIPIKTHRSISYGEKYLLKQIHTNRMDPGEYNVRSQESRFYKKGNIEPNNTVDRYKYSVTIDNKKYLRYEGDLQILKKSLIKDDRINVVADASSSSILIDLINPGDKFKFEIIGD